MLLISSPAKAWAEIKTEEDGRKVLGAFVYPMIGLCGLSVFIGTFIGNTAGVSAFQIAMTRCCPFLFNVCVDIISGLFSISILHWILQFYTVFVVYEGARTLMKVEETKLTRYTLIASVIVIVCPALIAAVFNELSVILN